MGETDRTFAILSHSIVTVTSVDEPAAERAARRQARTQSRMQRSRMMHDLRAEISDRPEEVSFNDTNFTTGMEVLA